MLQQIMYNLFEFTLPNFIEEKKEIQKLSSMAPSSLIVRDPLSIMMVLDFVYHNPPYAGYF